MFISVYKIVSDHKKYPPHVCYICGCGCGCGCGASNNNSSVSSLSSIVVQEVGGMGFQALVNSVQYHVL